jgi:hypothetical protein
MKGKQAISISSSIIDILFSWRPFPPLRRMTAQLCVHQRLPSNRVGQTAAIVMWLDTLPPVYSNGTETYWYNLMLTITDPNGKSETKGPFTTDAVASAYYPFTPTETGNYIFSFNFPGQNQIDGAHYSASTSPNTTLTVQNELIAAYPNSPLPTDYWARPIYGENREWAQIGGNWLGVTLLFGTGASSNGAFNHTTAPESGHSLEQSIILWRYRWRRRSHSILHRLVIRRQMDPTNCH